MARTKILVSKAVLHDVLFLPTDVKIEDVTTNFDQLSTLIVFLEGDVPDKEWSTVVVHKETIRMEILPLEEV